MKKNPRPSLLLQNKNSFRDSPRKTVTGWFTSKNENKEVTLFRQINILFNKNVNTLSNSLRSVLGDIDVSPLSRSTVEIECIEAQRDRIYIMGLDIMFKTMMARNQEAKKAIDYYSFLYNERVKKQPIQTVKGDKSKSTSPEVKNRSPQTSSKQKSRMTSSNALRHFSRSLIVHQQPKIPKQPPKIIQPLSRLLDFDCQQLPKLCSTLQNSSRLSTPKHFSSSPTSKPEPTSSRTLYPQTPFQSTFRSWRSNMLSSSPHPKNAVGPPFHPFMSKPQAYKRRQRERHCRLFL